MVKARGVITDGLIEVVDFSTIPVDLSSIPEQHRTRFFNPGELDALAYLLRNSKHVIEIGCQNGRTAKVLLNNLPAIESYIGIDVPPGSQLACSVQKTEVPDRAGELAMDEERFFLMLSKHGSALALYNLRKGVDAVFIDGDHSYSAVVRDHLEARKIVSKGGLIIHHDYHDLGTVGVKQAIQEMSANGEKFYHVKDTWLVYTIV